MGAASARIMVASVLHEEMQDVDEVTRILDEASQLVVVFAPSRRRNRGSLKRRRQSSRPRMCVYRKLDKLKDDFMATVSHEIRTPLTSIRSFSEILRDNPELDAAQRQEFITIIVNESERLSRLINDILDLAKMEAGTTRLGRSASISAVPIIEQALAGDQRGCSQNRPTSSSRSTWRRDLPADPRRSGSADPGDCQSRLERCEVLRQGTGANRDPCVGGAGITCGSMWRTTASALRPQTWTRSSSASSRPVIR